MAVITSPLDSTLRCQVQIGTNDSGNPILRTRTYNKVKADSQLDDKYAVAAGLMGLQKHPVYALNYVDTTKMEEM